MCVRTRVCSHSARTCERVAVRTPLPGPLRTALALPTRAHTARAPRWVISWNKSSVFHYKSRHPHRKARPSPAAAQGAIRSTKQDRGSCLDRWPAYLWWRGKARLQEYIRATSLAGSLPLTGSRGSQRLCTSIYGKGIMAPGWPDGVAAGRREGVQARRSRTGCREDWGGRSPPWVL